jgi:hypothetical protein
MAGDNATATDVQYWDGSKMEIVGLVRVDGVPLRFLGGCAR